MSEKTREFVLAEAMPIVEAIKRDIVPDLDENSGGEILVWLRDFGLKVHTHALARLAEKWRKEADEIEALAPDLMQHPVTFMVQMAESETLRDCADELLKG